LDGEEDRGMRRDDAWEENAQAWACFARSPGHDHLFWQFNGPRFLELVPPAGTGMRIAVPGVHRPLEAYTRALEREGLLLEALREPRPSKHQIARYPESARWQRIPGFLPIRARKP
jgi:hypothetical protein